MDRLFVYSLLAQNIITEDYYSRDERGAVWLEALGRRVIIQSVNDYLSEKESIKGMTRSRETHIFLYIQKIPETTSTASNSCSVPIN